MTLSELATVLRSKNAGPFRTTFDIFFTTEDAFLRVKNSGVLTKVYVAELYQMAVEDVYGIFYVEAARGIKITIEKPPNMASGDVHCRDLFGAQQHIPLLNVEIP